VDIQTEGDHNFVAHYNSVYAILFELATDAFNPHKGDAYKMLVKSSQDDGTTVIEVMDNGQGIAQGSEEAIFDYGHTRVGQGLGLCLARATMLAMGGSIEAMCKSDNPEYAGACFRMELPNLDSDKLVGLPYDF
jgi:K+-sensing histidine kinase KdpD